DSVFQHFWSRAIHWLAAGDEFLPGQSVALNVSSLAIEPDEPVTLEVATRYVEADTFTPTITVTGPDGESTSLSPTRMSAQHSRYTATFQPTVAGVYEVTLDAS